MLVFGVFAHNVSGLHGISVLAGFRAQGSGPSVQSLEVLYHGQFDRCTLPRKAKIGPEPRPGPHPIRRQTQLAQWSFRLALAY